MVNKLRVSQLPIVDTSWLEGNALYEVSWLFLPSFPFLDHNYYNFFAQFLLGKYKLSLTSTRQISMTLCPLISYVFRCLGLLVEIYIHSKLLVNIYDSVQAMNSSFSSLTWERLTWHFSAPPAQVGWWCAAVLLTSLFISFLFFLITCSLSL